SETPLKIHQVGDAIAHGPRHDGYASRESQTECREKCLPRLTFKVPQRHADSWRDQLLQPDTFQNGRSELCRGFRPHSLSWRKFHRLPNSSRDTKQRGCAAGRECHQNGRPVWLKRKRGKMKKSAVNDDNTISHPEADETANRCRDNHDHNSEFKIVESDLARGVAECFELGDLLTLKPNKPGKHSTRHKGG